MKRRGEFELEKRNRVFYLLLTSRFLSIILGSSLKISRPFEHTNLINQNSPRRRGKIIAAVKHRRGDDLLPRDSDP